MDVVQMVLCGKVNKDLVSIIGSMGGSAIGLSGLDGGLLAAQRLRDKDCDYGLVGDITEINPAVVSTALDNGYIPVVSTVARGVDADTAYNINADTAAAKLAIALHAEKLVLLTDVRGLLKDKNDEDTLIPVVNVYDVPRLMRDGIITGGMIPKIDCCVEAIRHGVRRAHILDGRIPHSILIEMLSDEGVGTMIL
jgi:acetylglutamate kinase